MLDYIVPHSRLDFTIRLHPPYQSFFQTASNSLRLGMNQDLPTKYAFELSAWDEILSWKLAPSSIYIYGLEFCLSRVLWEMTFFGVDESGVELEKEKLDTRFEEAQRFFDENKEPQIGFSIEDIAKKLLGDDYTEDWYPEEEQERDRRNMVISSYIASTTAALFWWVDG